MNDPDAARRARIARPGGRSLQALEQSAGRAEPLGPYHYRVEPGYGEGGAEFFPRGPADRFGGIEAAISRAAWLPGEQRVTRVRPDAPDLVIRRYRNGRQFTLITIGDTTP